MNTLFSQEVSFAQALPVLLVLLFLLAVAALVVIILVRYFRNLKQSPNLAMGTVKDPPYDAESTGTAPDTSASSPNNNKCYYTAILLSIAFLWLIGNFTILSASQILLSAAASACCAFCIPKNTRFRRMAITLYAFAGAPWNLPGILLLAPIIPLLLVRDR